MTWKKTLKQVLIMTVAISLAEVLLQKGTYSVLNIIMSTGSTVLAAYLLLAIIDNLIKSKSKINKNENT